MRKGKWYFLVAVLVLAGLASFYLKGRFARSEAPVNMASTAAPTREITFDKGLPSLRGLVKATKPSVVNISTTTVVKGMGNPFRGFPGNEDLFDKFFGNGPTGEFKQKSLGSGFIIDKEGYILTNNHVVEKATSIKVRLSDDKEYEAKVVGKDAKTDLALIKINAHNSLPVAVLGDSDKLEVGDWVMAVGNPYALDHTVTAGIVSAKGRVIGQGPYDDFIQTDASINPGNSGGPLFDLNGQVVGINTAIVSGGQGIGFAIPINMAKALLPQLKNKGKVVRGWLGVVIQKVTPDLAKTFGLKGTDGALVADVTEGGPAAKADMRRGDIIVSFDGKPVKEVDQLPRMVAATEVGKKVKVGFVREGRLLQAEVTLGETDEEKTRRAESASPQVEKNLGLVVQNVTPEIAHRLGLKDGNGVIVADVRRGSPAEEADMRAGDIIREMNRRPVANIDDFREILRKVRPGESVVVLVKRNGSTFYAVLGEDKDGE
jgi:serine protease Do